MNPGEEMTFTYEIYNTNGEEVTLQVVETLPENTTYLSGAETVEGSTLRWTVTVPGDTRVKVSYKLQVNEKTPYGTKIQSTASTVGGVQVKCPAVQVQRSLTAAEQEKLIQAAQELRTQGNTLTGLKLVNQLYQTATGKTVFATTNVTEIAEDIFAKHQMSTEEIPQQLYRFNADSAYGKMVAPTLYGGYRVWSQMWQHQRTSLPRQQDLQVGDVLVGRTSTTWELYLYLGQELGFVNMTTATLEADTLTVPLRLERLLGYGHYFAILRPAMTM